MLNIGVICDTTWDNFILMDKKFKKIDPEKFRINCIYGKTLEIFTNCINRYNLTIIRHYSENICNTLFNMLKCCDLWIIFTNNIEYLTPPSLILEKCDEYNIKYIIIREFNRENDYYSFEIDKTLSFKKMINSTTKKNETPIIQFDYKLYNDNYSLKQIITLHMTPQIRDKIKSNYNIISDNKKTNSIKLLYDKDECKKEKQVKKTMKEATQFQLLNNRLTYYKN